MIRKLSPFGLSKPPGKMHHTRPHYQVSSIVSHSSQCLLTVSKRCFRREVDKNRYLGPSRLLLASASQPRYSEVRKESSPTVDIRFDRLPTHAQVSLYAGPRFCIDQMTAAIYDTVKPYEETPDTESTAKRPSASATNVFRVHTVSITT